ncbi:MAG TPA: endonuclease/exonuclease/phosphatase family protein [Thermoleophilaceae bacterium]|nr:endonuclease/exonuclease/phosphatase family protein [Thermoleophilaceae bacterium]
MRVLSWNLYHGRDFPPDEALFTLRSRLLRVTERNETHAQVNRALRGEFTGWVADQEWDVALLQEAPPLWFSAFRRRTGAAGARVFTSRNVVPPLQRLAAIVNPDLIASWEGGSNQLLVREPGRILETRRMILTLRPERRTMLWARVELPDGATVCVANLHASAGLPQKASAEALAAAASAVEWSEGDPLVFGGDMNLRPGPHPAAFAELRERFGLGDPTGPKVIDHLLARGLEVVEPTRQLAPEDRELPERDGRRLRLSDHAPVTGRWDVGSPRAAR